MILKTLAAAACISLASATTAISAPITLDFEFDGVTGTFYGLDDNDGTSSATSLDLFFEGSTWTGLNISGPFVFNNSFEFAAGDLMVVDFAWGFIDSFSDSGLFRLGDIALSSSFSSFANITRPEPFRFFEPSGSVSYEINPVSAVPLPAGGLLLLSAFGGVAALKRRKKRAA